MLLLLLVAGPLLAFFFFLKQGFDPYEELTNAEASQKNGSMGWMLMATRSVCHLFIILLTVYLISLWVTISLLRKS